MYYGNIKKFDIANGEGIRTSLFVSGCTNRCKNCFQPETWDFNYGKPFTEDTWEEIFDSMKISSVRGLTILGGEPMEVENQRALLPFIRAFKEKYPEKDLWIFTGNLYEELTDSTLAHPKRIAETDELLSYVNSLSLSPICPLGGAAIRRDDVADFLSYNAEIMYRSIKENRRIPSGLRPLRTRDHW